MRRLASAIAVALVVTVGGAGAAQAATGDNGSGQPTASATPEASPSGSQDSTQAAKPTSSPTPSATTTSQVVSDAARVTVTYDVKGHTLYVEATVLSGQPSLDVLFASTTNASVDVSDVQPGAVLQFNAPYEGCDSWWAVETRAPGESDLRPEWSIQGPCDEDPSNKVGTDGKGVTNGSSSQPDSSYDPGPWLGPEPDQGDDAPVPSPTTSSPTAATPTAVLAETGGFDARGWLLGAVITGVGLGLVGLAIWRSRLSQ